MSRSLRGWVLVTSLITSMTALGGKKDDPPPPPPPPPPIEETGSAPAAESSSSSSSSTSADWSIKGSDGLLDKGTGHVRKPMLSFFVGVPWWGRGYTGPYYSTFTLGFGGRFYLPIVKEGFLPMLNDSFGVEFGVDGAVVFPGYPYNIGGELQVPAEARWNFHLFPKLDVYAKVGFGVGVLFAYAVYVYPVVVANVGALFKITETISLRAEIGSPALKIGIGFAF